jgi:hypothetical protein
MNRVMSLIDERRLNPRKTIDLNKDIRKQNRNDIYLTIPSSSK